MLPAKEFSALVELKLREHPEDLRPWPYLVFDEHLFDVLYWFGVNGTALVEAYGS